MRHYLITGVGVASIVIFLATIAGAETMTVFGTGVDASGNVMAGGSTDPHYFFSDLNIQAVVYSSTSMWPLWLPDDAGSAWVGFKDSGDTSPYGTHDIITTFDLTGYDPTSATLSGSWVGDQYGTLFLNGNAIQSVPNENWNYLDGHEPTPFFITSGFSAGQNILDFQVTFPDNFDGLRVLPMTLTATPTQGVPDASSTLMLLGCALAGLGGIRRKLVR